MRYRIRAAAKPSERAELTIYGDIGQSWDEAESNDAKTVINALQSLTGPVDVRINSFGGSVADGLAIFNALRRHSDSVTTHIDGVAYSIASLIAMDGSDVRIAANAMLMIHAPWGMAVGNAPEMREMADMLDKHAEAMLASYVRTGGPSSDTIRGWLTDGKDHYFTAAEAVEAGLADSVTDSAPVFEIAAALRGSAREYRLPVAHRRDFPPPEEATSMADQDPGAPKGAEQIVAAHSATVTRAKKEGAKAEADRRSHIDSVFAQFFDADPLNPVTALRSQCMDDLGCDELQARRTLLDYLADRTADPIISPQAYAPQARQPAAPPGASRHLGGMVQAGPDARDKLAEGIERSLLVRAGLEPSVEIVREVDASGYRGRSLLRIGEEWLRAAGVDPSRMDDKGIARQLFVRASSGPHTGSDFSAILANVATKSAMKGWMEAGTTWQTWCNTGSLPDFKQATIAGLGAFPDLDEIPRSGGPYKHGSMDDAYETAQLVTYGKLFGISREAIINDDLGEFTRVPQKMGMAAGRKINGIVYNVLTQQSYTGQLMTEDSVRLFNAASHSNYIASGSGAAPSTTTLNTAAAAMRKQKAPLPTGDSSAAYLNISPAYLLTVPELEGTTRAFIQGQWDPAGTTASVSKRDAPNIWQNRLEIVVDPALTLTTGWWLSAGKNTAIDTVTVFFLNGQESPYIEQMDNGTSDGATFKVRIDAVARALDFRGLYFNYGA